MDRFRRKRSHARVSSPSKVTTIIDRTSDDKRITTDKAHKGRDQITKGNNSQKFASDSGSCRTSITTEEDLLKIHLGPRTSRTGTVMNKLLAEEISGDIESKRRSPSIIARLMGLDGLPPRQNANKQHKRITENHEQRTAYVGLHKTSNSYDNQSLRKSSKVQPRFKDVYEVMEISKVERRCSPSQVALSRRHSEDEKTFVRRKFRDAKCLYTDEKLQESKEFDDSLGALDSNKELLLKFLSQPNSMFAKHLHDLHGAHEFHYGHVRSMKSSALKHNINAIGCQSGREASGKIDISFSHKHQNGFQSHSDHGQVSDSHTSSHVPAEGEKDACPIPRRIVVLKPNIVNGQNAVKFVSSANSSCDLLSDFQMPKEIPSVRNGEAELWSKKILPDDLDISGHKSREPRELAAEITQRMRNKLSKSSFNISLSACKGYSADESSHDLSGNDSSYCSETTGISEAPIYWSSQGKASVSYCSESSVNREAKKRMSERWKMTHRSQEAGLVRKGSTLGEMLAVPDLDMRPSNLETVITQDGHFGRFMGNNGLPGSVGPLGISSRDGWKDGCVGTLSRSRSLPASTHLGSPKTSMRHEALGAERFLVPKECISHRRNKAVKRSFNRKEGSFSGGGRPRKKKSDSVLHVDKDITDVQEFQFHRSQKKSGLEEMESPDVKATILEAPCRNVDTILNLDAIVDVEHENVPKSLACPDEQINALDFSGDVLVKDESCSSDVHEPMSQECSRRCLIEGLASFQCPAIQPEIPVSSKEADQPSPVSVLEASFVEDLSSGSECFERVSADLHGLRMQLQLLKLESKAYDEGPILVSTDEDSVEGSNACPIVRGSPIAEESWECSYLVDVLIDSGFDDTNPDMLDAAQNFPKFPIAPWVFEKLEKKYSHQATCSRSERKLLFDCINSGIVEIFRQSMDPHPWVVVKVSAMSGRPRLHKDGLKSELQKLLKGHEIIATETIIDPVLQRDCQWVDLGDHIDVIGIEIGNLLIDELVAELVTMSRLCASYM